MLLFRVIVIFCVIVKSEIRVDVVYWIFNMVSKGVYGFFVFRNFWECGIYLC